MKVFIPKRIVLVLVLVFIAAAILGVYKNREYVQQLPIGCSFKAKALCAAIFVSGRDDKTVEREDMGFNNLFKLFKAEINLPEKASLARFWGREYSKEKRYT